MDVLVLLDLAVHNPCVAAKRLGCNGLLQDDDDDVAVAVVQRAAT